MRHYALSFVLSRRLHLDAVLSASKATALWCFANVLLLLLLLLRYYQIYCNFFYTLLPLSLMTFNLSKLLDRRDNTSASFTAYNYDSHSLHELRSILFAVNCSVTQPLG